MTVHEEPDRQAVYRDWIKRALEITGEKKTPFFKKAGLHGSTASRAMADDSTVRIEPETIDKLSKFWRIPAPPIHMTRGNGTTRGFAEPDLVRYDGPPLSDLHPDQAQWIVATRALELAGYMPGDIITTDRRVSPRDGDACYVELGGSPQTVFRKFRAPYFVVTATIDPGSEDKPRQVDNESVVVVATVIRSERMRRG